MSNSDNLLPLHILIIKKSNIFFIKSLTEEYKVAYDVLKAYKIITNRNKKIRKKQFKSNKVKKIICQFDLSDNIMTYDFLIDKIIKPNKNYIQAVVDFEKMQLVNKKDTFKIVISIMMPIIIVIITGFYKLLIAITNIKP